MKNQPHPNCNLFLRFVRETYFFTLAVLLIFLQFSCATGYKNVAPDTEGGHFYQEFTLDSISYGYDVDLFKTQAKKRYVKKAERQGVDIIGFKITNHSAVDTLRPIRDLRFYIGEKVVKPLTTKETQKLVKQGEVAHFAWYLIALPIPSVIDVVGPFVQVPIALIIANYNLFRSGSENRRFMGNLKDNEVMYKNIPPGETIYGMVSFKDLPEGQLEFRKIKR